MKDDWLVNVQFTPFNEVFDEVNWDGGGGSGGGEGGGVVGAGGEGFVADGNGVRGLATAGTVLECWNAGVLVWLEFFRLCLFLFVYVYVLVVRN